MNLKSKTAVFATLTSVIVLLLSSWLSLETAEAEIRQQVSGQQQAMVTRLAGEIDGKFAFSHRVLRSVADSLPPDLPRSELRPFLDSKPALMAVFSDAVIFAPDGTILTDKPILRGRAGSNHADREYLRRTLATRQPVVSEPLLGRFSQAPIVILTVPVLDEHGGVALVLAGVVRLFERSFLGGIADLPVGLKGHALLATRNGQIVMHPQRERILTRLETGYAAFDHAAQATVFSEETRAPGFPALVSYAPVQAPGWVLAAVLPIAEVHAPVDSMRKAILWSTVALLVFVPGLGWVGTAYLMRPLDAVQDALRAMRERPDAHVEVPVASRDEIGELAANLNRVTEARRQADRVLRLLSRAVEQSPVSIVITDPGGAIQYVNPKFSGLTGYALDEVVGAKPNILKSGQTPSGEYERLWRTIKAGGEWSGELQNRKKNGELYWEFARIMPITDGTGAITHFLAVKEDITEARRVEAELRELNQSLERRVAERTADLKASNEELEAFSYSVSHDLRAPLRAINGFSAMLEEQCAGKLDADERRLLERVTANVQRMGELIDDLLDLSRVTRVELRPERVNVAEMTRHIVRTLREREPARSFECSCPPEATLWGDAKLLRIVLENLLGNAWKYTGRAEHPRIACTWRREGGEAVFSVADNGAGFDMAYAGKLFGAFQRLHALSEFEGTGIGLALVKRIVVRHGGRVWAEAEPGRGATFHFALPEPAA